MKSRRVFSTRSISLTSWRMTTTPPPGSGAALRLKLLPGRMGRLRLLRISWACNESSTVRKSCGSRRLSTNGCWIRGAVPKACSKRALAHSSRISGDTAITTSGRLSSSVCIWARLTSIARKLSSSRCAVVSRAAETWAISSKLDSRSRAVKSPSAIRPAKCTMRFNLRATLQAKTSASTTAARLAQVVASSNSLRILARSCWMEASGYARRTAPPRIGVATYMKSTPIVRLVRIESPTCPASAARNSGLPAWFSMVSGWASESASTLPEPSITVTRA